MALHKDLSGADIHEPKGISTATSGQVYQADGAGSGTWSSLVIPTGQFNITLAVFTADGTWTKPADCFMAEVICIGGGGSGASPSQNGTASNFGPGLCQADGGTGTGGGNTGVGDYIFPGGDGVAVLNHLVGGQAGLRFGNYGQGGKSDGTAAAGGGGAAAVKYLYTLPATASVSIGVGAAGDSTGNNDANNGIVVVRQFITV